MLTWEKEVSKLVEPIMKQIMGLQFIQGFINADLPREKFAAYLAQDILYCKEYQSFLVTLSEKVEEEEYKKFFKERAESKTSYILDREKVGKEFGIGDNLVKNKICFNYLNFLKNSIENGTVCEGLAAIFPCCWVYDELSMLMYKDFKHENNPYEIMLKVKKEPSPKRLKMQEICNLYAEKFPNEKEKMNQLFIKGVEYELHFFEYSYVE